ncbi:hypothetical protein J2S34_001512 [Nitrobacter winogradskyi]|uniref:Uncharacterized protein n=1 Tax=Nitrobacter winogradskyi TaxID=913 RepID=A0ACC6AGV9_NITWI|nr:hypothetical protein [Nitrobacter winogradskyi]
MAGTSLAMTDRSDFIKTIMLYSVFERSMSSGLSPKDG